MRESKPLKSSDLDESITESTWVRWAFKTWLTGLLVVSGIAAIPTATAHGGTVHAETPHWILLAVTLMGLSIVTIALFFGRTRWATKPRRVLTGIFAGGLITMVGTIALTQIQIEPVGTTPIGRQWYPVLSGASGILLMTGSFVLGQLRWPHRPLYAMLGFLLGLWVAYPVLIPGSSLTNPLGYVLVVAVVALVAYLVWCDVRPALDTSGTDRLSRRTGLASGILFTVFLLFSAGLFSVNPDEGVNRPTSAFVTIVSFADPLVVWPAVEFYLPSIPLIGALSIGMALVIGLLAVLIGVNTTLMTTVWQQDLDLSGSRGVVGAVATTGATACCCCGPAVYAIASAVFGLSATPLYWAFVSPSSPVGALFLVGAITLLTGSAIELSDSIYDSNNGMVSR